MQLPLRIPPINFFFQTRAVFLPPFFKYVVFQVQSEGYIGEDKIIDMIKVIVLYFMS